MNYKLELKDLERLPLGLRAKVAYSIRVIRQLEAESLRLNPDEGFLLAFSGGKDSVCLYSIAHLAGVKFTPFMNLTSIDPPEVLRYVKRYFPRVRLERPKESIYSLALKKKMLPTRKLRWCCQLMKEGYGAGSVVLLGIRAAESVARAKRSEIEVSSHKGSYSLYDYEQNSQLVSGCIKGKERLMVSPIHKWTDADVWTFIRTLGIPYCHLYNEGYHRIGCIACPMASLKEKRRDIARYPHVRKRWLWAIQRLRPYFDSRLTELSNEQIFEWWLSSLSINEFRANLFLQKTIEFDDKD